MKKVYAVEQWYSRSGCTVMDICSNRAAAESIPPLPGCYVYIREHTLRSKSW